MSFFSTAAGRAAATMVAVAVIIGGALYLSGNRPAVGGPSPSVVPTAAPSRPPAASPPQLGTSGWTPISSARYHYDVRYPASWSATQSSRAWTLAADQNALWKTSDFVNLPAFDVLTGPDPVLSATTDIFTVFEVDLPPGTTRDQWIATYFGPDSTGSAAPCIRRMDGYPPFDVEGHQAVLWTEPHTSVSCGETYAFAVVGTRLYSFTMGGPGREAILEALLSTVQFQP